MRKIPFILLIFILISCSTTEKHRRVASAESAVRLGEVDLKKSLVHLFPAAQNDGSLWYYFYLQLKDRDGHYVDCDPASFTLKTTKGLSLPFKFERLLSGRYYVTLEKTEEIHTSELDFFLHDKKLKERFRLELSKPDRAHSKVIIEKNVSERMTLKLILRDKDNRPVETPEPPEIILDGIADIESITHIREGMWEIKLVYPDQNQIMYLSVRAQGVYFTNLLRYQHVEK